MYRNYIFDLYGTLVDIHTVEDDRQVWEKLRLFYGYYGAGYTAEELREAYDGRVKSVHSRAVRNAAREGTGKASMKIPRYDHEACPEIELSGVFRALFTEKGVDPDDLTVLHAGQIFRVLTTDYLRLYDGACDMLAELRRRGKQIYLLTNAQRIFTEYELVLLGIADCFDGILISSDCGVKKPDTRFFRLLQERYGLNPAQSIMIGNDEVCDIAGAKGAGMDACYLHSNLSPEYTGTAGADYAQKEICLGKLCGLLCR